MRCAFADTLEHCGDPEDANTAAPQLTAAQLVDKAYAVARAKEAGLNTDAVGWCKLESIETRSLHSSTVQLNASTFCCLHWVVLVTTTEESASGRTSVSL